MDSDGGKAIAAGPGESNTSGFGGLGLAGMVGREESEGE